jgi:hypothetical protein
MSFAYLSEPLPSRVLFGPFPGSRDQIENLLDKAHVTHIVNLKPETDRVTAKGKPADRSYERHWLHEKSKLPVPVLLRYPVLSASAKRREWVAWYVESAQRIAEQVKGTPKACVYVHNEEGFVEEAILAFVLCEVMERGSVPNVDEWIANHPHSEGVLTSADARDLLRECLEHLGQLRENQGKQASLKGWVTVRKRAKVE